MHLEGNFSNPNRYLLEGESWQTAPGESTLGSMAVKGVHTVDAIISLVVPVKHVVAQSLRKVLSVGNNKTSLLLGFGNVTSGYIGTMDATGFLFRLSVFG